MGYILDTVSTSTSRLSSYLLILLLSCYLLPTPPPTQVADPFPALGGDQHNDHLDVTSGPGGQGGHRQGGEALRLQLESELLY